MDDSFLDHMYKVDNDDQGRSMILNDRYKRLGWIKKRVSQDIVVGLSNFSEDSILLCVSAWQRILSTY